MNNRSDSGEKVQTFGVEKIFKYDVDKLRRKTFREDDIALIKLDRTVNIDEYILPICLPTAQDNAEKALAAGFGTTETGELSESLQKITLDRIDHEICEDYFAGETLYSDSMVCYGKEEGLGDTCGVRI